MFIYIRNDIVQTFELLRCNFWL